MTILGLILDSQCRVSLNHQDVCHCVSKSQLGIMMGLIISFLFFVARSVISQSFRHVKFRCWDVVQKQGRWTLPNTFLAFFLLYCFSVNDRNQYGWNVFSEDGDHDLATLLEIVKEIILAMFPVKAMSKLFCNCFISFVLVLVKAQ